MYVDRCKQAGILKSKKIKRIPDKYKDGSLISRKCIALLCCRLVLQNLNKFNSRNSDKQREEGAFND